MKAFSSMTAIIVSFAIVPPLYGATTASFDGGADTPSTLQAFGALGSPSHQAAGGNPGGYLQLTNAINSQHNWATFDRSNVGSFGQSTFSFDFLINPTVTPSADGFSFSYAATSVYGTTGGIGAVPFSAEDPAAAGVLGFGFDTWSNFGLPDGQFDNPFAPLGSDYQEISVFYDGALVYRIDDTRFLASPLTLDDGDWHSVAGSVDFTDGHVSLSVDGHSILNQLAVPGLVPFESRVMLAARTGGENEIAGIDNINVQFPEPAVDPVYEGFDYTPGTNLRGASGGAGFIGPWGSGSTVANFGIGAGSLSYPKIATTGNHVTTAAHDSGIGSIGRRLVTPLGEPGTTRYVSFVVRAEGTLNEGQSNGFFGLRLETGSSGDLFIGKPGNGAIDQFVLNNAGGTLQHATGTTVEVGQDYLLVLRADFTTTGNDLFTLYVNPTPGAPEPTGGTIKNDFDFGIFNEIFLYATGAFSIDEVRIGADFADVVPLQPLPGDYNLNGAVDAADYTLWRDHLGQTFLLTNENPAAATPGIVDAEDYAFWKSQFGNSFGSGSGLRTHSRVPEPATFVLLMIAVAGWSLRRGPAE